MASPAGTLSTAPGPIVTPAGLTNQKLATGKAPELMVPLIVDGVPPVTRETRLAKEKLEYVDARSLLNIPVSPVSMLNVWKLKNRLWVAPPGLLTKPWLAGMV